MNGHVGWHNSLGHVKCCVWLCPPCCLRTLVHVYVYLYTMYTCTRVSAVVFEQYVHVHVYLSRSAPAVCTRTHGTRSKHWEDRDLIDWRSLSGGSIVLPCMGWVGFPWVPISAQCPSAQCPISVWMKASVQCPMPMQYRYPSYSIFKTRIHHYTFPIPRDGMLPITNNQFRHQCHGVPSANHANPCNPIPCHAAVNAWNLDFPFLLRIFAPFWI